MRRVVTGVGADGRGTIAWQDTLEPIVGRQGSSNQTRLCWATPDQVILPHDDSDPAAAGVMSMPAVGEARFVMVTLAPHAVAPMHLTPTVDFVVVTAGELWLVMEDGGESRLVAGDAVIQNGTRHAWENRSDEPCTIAATMIGARMAPSPAAAGQLPAQTTKFS